MHKSTSACQNSQKQLHDCVQTADNTMSMMLQQNLPIWQTQVQLYAPQRAPA